MAVTLGDAKKSPFKGKFKGASASLQIRSKSVLNPIPEWEMKGEQDSYESIYFSSMLSIGSPFISFQAFSTVGVTSSG